MRYSVCLSLPRSSAGAALILALFITALVGILSIRFAEDFSLNISRVQNRWQGNQARYYLYGAEDLAAVALKQDDLEVDHLFETWAQDVPPFVTDDGLLQAKLEDAQGRLNLNGLGGSAADDDNFGNSVAERFTPQQRRFIRLLQAFDNDDKDIDEPRVEVSEDEAVAITEAIIDWLDEDDDPRGFGGAESGFYNRQEPPYEPANGLFESVSELRQIRGITPELYEALEPFVVALPSEEADLNVNTVLPKLFRTINGSDNLQPQPRELVDDVVEDRDLNQSYEDLDEFLESVSQLVVIDGQVDSDGLGVTTSFFLLSAQVQVGEQIRYLTGHLRRDDEGKVTVYKRRYTSF